MRIRPASIDDGPRLWALRIEMLADAPLAYLDTLDALVERGVGDYLNRVAGWITDPDQAVFVAESGGRLAGQVRAFDEHGSTGLVMVYVTPDWRGRGVLADLVEAAGVWSIAQGRSRLVLAVMARNLRAIRAYEKLGFVSTGVTYPNPYLPVFTEIEMARGTEVRSAAVTARPGTGSRRTRRR